MQLNFTPFPNLNTDRLLLRQLKNSDVEEIFALRSNEENAKHLDRPLATKLEDAEAFIQRVNTQTAANNLVFWGLVPIGQTKIIGTICLWQINNGDASAEIGYELHPDFHGQRFMQEAIPPVIEYGFKEMQLQLINANVSPQNLKSIKLLEKYNFILSGPGDEKGTVLYQLRS